MAVIGANEGLFLQTLMAGQTTTLYYTIADERYLEGLGVYIKDSAFGDTLQIEVVVPAVPNVSPEAVLATPVKTWGVYDGDRTLLLQRKPMPAGLKLKLTYISTGQTDVKFIINGFMSKEV